MRQCSLVALKIFGMFSLRSSLKMIPFVTFLDNMRIELGERGDAMKAGQDLKKLNSICLEVSL